MIPWRDNKELILTDGKRKGNSNANAHFKGWLMALNYTHSTMAKCYYDRVTGICLSEYPVKGGGETTFDSHDSNVGEGLDLHSSSPFCSRFIVTQHLCRPIFC